MGHDFLESASRIVSALYPYPGQMEYWYGWPAWILLLCGPLGLVIFWTYRKWDRIASEYRKLPQELIELSKDGVVASRVTLSRCKTFADDSLSRGAAACRSHGQDRAAQQLEAMISDSGLGQQWRDVASRALTTGRLASVLHRADAQLLYVVAFPGRHEHPRGIRRYSAFSSGWLDHVKDLRRALDNSSRELPLHCFLLFLRPDARDGVSLYSLDASEIQIAPKQILDETERRSDSWNHVDDGCEFSFS